MVDQGDHLKSLVVSANLDVDGGSIVDGESNSGWCWFLLKVEEIPGVLV